MINFWLYQTLLILIGLFGVLVIVSRSPINSVIFLAGMYLAGGGIFILLDHYFLGLTLVIVYVGELLWETNVMILTLLPMHASLTQVRYLVRQGKTILEPKDYVTLYPIDDESDEFVSKESMDSFDYSDTSESSLPYHASRLSHLYNSLPTVQGLSTSKVSLNIEFPNDYPSHLPKDFPYVALCTLMGCILGDGSVMKVRENYRFEITQESPRNSQFIAYLHYMLSQYMDCTPITTHYRLGSNGKDRIFHRFRVHSYPIFNWFKDIFTPNVPMFNDHKLMPVEIHHYLTPLTLALWIQCDGSAASTSSLHIATHCFTVQDLERVSKSLNKLYDIKVSLHADTSIRTNATRIYIHAASMPKLVKLCRPYTVPSMYYKYNNLM